MSQDLIKRLRYLMELFDRGQLAAFAKRCNILPSTLSNYVNRGSLPTVDKIAKIAQATGVSLRWLILGEGSPFENQEEFVYIPRLDIRLGAGGTYELFDAAPKEVYAFRRDWIAKFGNPNLMRLALVHGDSMEPTLSNGDLVLINLGDKEHLRDGIYALRLHNGLLVKRVQRTGRDTIRLISDNPRYPPEQYSFPNQDLEIIGRVIWVGKTL